MRQRTPCPVIGIRRPRRNHDAHPECSRPKHTDEASNVVHIGNIEPTRACSKATPRDRGGSEACAREHQSRSGRAPKQHCAAMQRRRLQLPACREAQGQHSRTWRQPSVRQSGLGFGDLKNWFARREHSRPVTQKRKSRPFMQPVNDGSAPRLHHTQGR